MDCNWDCQASFPIIVQTPCLHSWNSGIRYFISLETWRSSDGAFLEKQCIDMGPASGNDDKVRIDDYNGGFNIYFDKDNNGTYEVGPIQSTSEYAWDWMTAPLIAGVFMPEKFDGGTTIGISTNKSNSYGMKYRNAAGTWVTAQLGSNDCSVVDPSGPPVDYCTVNTTTDHADSWGT